VKVSLEYASHRAVRVGITQESIDVAALHREVEDAGAGCTMSFIGTVRNQKQGRAVLRIVYESYESMATRVLRRIAAEAVQRWPVRRLVVIHRTGVLQVGDASVAIVVSTAHRAEGFEVLRFVIEAVKQDVPVWKKEHFEDGAVWVQEGP
jgi:molybdopterin synthase catalytic subunit